jgi:hypothetical protein
VVWSGVVWCGGVWGGAGGCGVGGGVGGGGGVWGGGGGCGGVCVCVCVCRLRTLVQVPETYFLRSQLPTSFLRELHTILWDRTSVMGCLLRLRVCMLCVYVCVCVFGCNVTLAYLSHVCVLVCVVCSVCYSGLVRVRLYYTISQCLDVDLVPLA